MAARGIDLNLNGRACTVHAEENTPLLYVLRNDCDLKGTRFGCGASQCGSCHVLLDGASVPACDTPLWAAEGKVVRTVEGLGEDGALHPLQQAFIDEQAAQCGYCLSGILISAAALLQQNPNPSEAEVRQALDKHLCRCGSHNRIVRAVLRAAAVMGVAA
ncbi:(2Fe-2S)-binding protein [Polaromonas sp.]|uniref:(2Fe-2S)-binding protein n=1 Tax=Polaromonas sp. TaxID=1869339 RepID=UPI003BA9A17F